MADRFKPQEFDINSINGGVRYKDGDGIQGDSINAAIEAAAYAQALATNPPDTTNANNVGTPTVSIQKTFDGTPQLKFENLKGGSGAKLVSQTLQGQDANGGNIYLQTFDDDTTATFIAPKGVDGTDGQDGVGISSITTTTTTTSGGANTVKITLTDGTTKTFYVYNGEKGDSGVTGVKGNAESSYRTGNVNITPANIGAVPTSRTVNGKPLSSNISLTAADVGASGRMELLWSGWLHGVQANTTNTSLSVTISTWANYKYLIFVGTHDYLFVHNMVMACNPDETTQYVGSMVKLNVASNDVGVMTVVRNGSTFRIHQTGYFNSSNQWNDRTNHEYGYGYSIKQIYGIK